MPAPRAAILMLPMLLTAALKPSLDAMDMAARTASVTFLRRSAEGLRFFLSFPPEDGAHQSLPRGCPRRAGMALPIGFRDLPGLSGIPIASSLAREWRAPAQGASS